MLRHCFIFCILHFAFCIFLSSCSKQAPERPKLHFETEARCPITPVKSQGSSSSCWIYAMLATIESNRIAMGDSVNLSAVYFDRMLITEQAEAVFMNKGNGTIKTRGMMPHLMTLLDRYGVLAEDSYHRRNDNLNFRVLVREVELLAHNAATNGLGYQKFKSDLNSLLDKEISFLPNKQFMLGAEYSPEEFGHSIARVGDYEFLGADYAFPDRRESDVVQSVEPDSLLEITEKCIRAGKAVCWEGDTSEPGYDWANGVADVAADRETILKNYHKDIETFKTTDDHCLEICGIAHDSAGRKFFICKNSWGASNRFGGLIFMSFEYFLAKTILIGKPTELDT